MIICDVCGSPMVVRKGPHSDFWGCTTYPNCKNTKPFIADSSYIRVAPTDPMSTEESSKRAGTVVLISCSKLKRSYPCEAQLLYDASSLFKKSLSYAKTISDDIFVISAKHGLVPLDKNIAPYEETLNDKTSGELAEWGENIAEQITERFNIENTEFIILAGKNYYSPLRKHLSQIKLPLLGLQIGERMAKLDELLHPSISSHDAICLKLHHLFNNIPRFRWDMIGEIEFDNGIYLIFEDGETYHGLDRIVRVGTHRSDGRLRGRLKDHFVNENKDGSIFRKNIGRSILNKNKNAFLYAWNIDSRDKDAVMNLGNRYNPSFQKKVENTVTEYMRNHFTFACLPVATSSERLRLEEGIIAVLNMANDFVASPIWRGRYSPEHEISQSGMWLKQGLDSSPLTEQEFTQIENYSRFLSPAIASQLVSDEKKPKFVSANVAQPQTNTGRMCTQDVADYLANMLDQAKEAGAASLAVKSGELHKELGLVNRFPMVCSAMYKIKKPYDNILEAPPKGQGSRLVIEYKF